MLCYSISVFYFGQFLLNFDAETYPTMLPTHIANFLKKNRFGVGPFVCVWDADDSTSGELNISTTG